VKSYFSPMMRQVAVPRPRKNNFVSAQPLNYDLHRAMASSMEARKGQKPSIILQLFARAIRRWEILMTHEADARLGQGRATGHHGRQL